MKGKHAARSALRREDQEVAAEIAAYRRNILRLTKERDESREAHRAYKQKMEASFRVLTVERDEGISPALSAARYELSRLRGRLAGYERFIKLNTSTWIEFEKKAIAAVRDALGDVSWKEAREIIQAASPLQVPLHVVARPAQSMADLSERADRERLGTAQAGRTYRAQRPGPG